MVLFSLVKFNILITAFRLRVLFYKILEIIIKKFTFFNNRVSFSYLHIVVKKYNLVLALVIAYNGKGASNISVDEFR